MRRPQQEAPHYHYHHHHQHQHHHYSHHQNQFHHSQDLSPSSPVDSHHRNNEKDESRLARVKRVLAGSLLGRGGGSHNRNSNRVFGVRLETVDSYSDTGVPYVIYRLCNYIENYGFHSESLFRLSGGNPRLTERLRTAFERKGDADLEGAGCPSTAATLLRQYLKELPQPLVPSSLVARLLHVHAQEYTNYRETWVEHTQQLLLSLPPSHHRLFGYLVNYLSKYEARHGKSSGVCGVFAPVVLPHVPPATILLRDILTEASKLFPDCNKDLAIYPLVLPSDCTVCCKVTKDELNNFDNTNLLCALKPRKRKERREYCCQERKLIRSNSEEHIFENSENIRESIRRVSSHEDFNIDKHHHIISQLGQDMGHGVRCGGLPLHERTNVSPVSIKRSPLPSPCDVLITAERLECDVERVRSTERFSRSIAPRGRRQIRRKKVHKGSEIDSNTIKEIKENDNEINPSHYIESSDTNTGVESSGQSFLEMLSSGPSRSPSPARPLSLDNEDPNNPVPTNWSFQHRPGDVEGDENNELVEAMLSPRNSLLVPRRFYSENDETTPIIPSPMEHGLKNLTKHINGLKKKIKKYEDEFEENFGYRPSHSDKMSNRDIKRLCTELNKLRKEHKLLKEDPISALRAKANNNQGDNLIRPANNNNSPEKSRMQLMGEMVDEVERKLSEKRIKYDRPDNMEEMTYEQLLEEKISVQKALLHIEGAFGRPVFKEDRVIVRPLYDKYRMMKRLLNRTGPNKHKDSISELATILEHEAMDFTSSSLPGNAIDNDRRASEPDMSHRGILDCIDAPEQLPTDSDSQHSSSESSRGASENLHALPHDDLIIQQKVTREEKKRLRRALKELEVQFEARAGRRMQREDRGPHITMVYESYKQTKAKLRLIDALLAKNA